MENFEDDLLMDYRPWIRSRGGLGVGGCELHYISCLNLHSCVLVIIFICFLSSILILSCLEGAILVPYSVITYDKRNLRTI